MGSNGDRPDHKVNGVLLTLGIAAAALDTFTTWIALHHAGFGERSAGTASLISSLGLPAGLVVSVLLRTAAFALVIVAAHRFGRISRLLLAIGFAAVAITWLVALSNIVTIATSG